jgi:endo-1,4-beta-xylanase
LEAIKWIREYGKRYPHTQLIDVVNEPLHNPPHYKGALGGDGLTGWDWVIWACNTARRYCPRSGLLVNEYNILEGGPGLERFIGLIRLLKKRNLIDGIGVQGHNLENVSVSAVKFSLDRLGRLGLPIYVSELDVDIANDEAQLNVYKSLFPVMWQCPAVAGVTLWGYKQYRIWRRNAYLLRADGRERPALAWLRAYLKR